MTRRLVDFWFVTVVVVSSIDVVFALVAFVCVVFVTFVPLLVVFALVGFVVSFVVWFARVFGRAFVVVSFVVVVRSVVVVVRGTQSTTGRQTRP